MPLFSMLVAPIPAIRLPMIFSSKVRSSSSSSWARATPTVMTRPTPNTTAASLSARNGIFEEFRGNQVLASVSRIALFLFTISAEPVHRPATAPHLPREVLSAGIRALLRRVPPGGEHTIGAPTPQQTPHRQG